MMLEQIVQKQKDLIALRDRTRQLASTPATYGVKADNGGRVIGLKIPDALRDRIVEQQKALGLPSYTAALGVCIDLGVQALELAAKDLR